ncbi:MAG: hypothetical protein K8S87_12185 [Planctomycetes bacterium]|nr:hypothetical protein [Planctomycetota bacterium]
MDDKEFGFLLVASGMLTDSQLESARNYQASLGGPLSSIIVRLGFIKENLLLEFTGEQEGMKIVDLNDIIIPIKLIESIPTDIIEKYMILPIHQTNDTITLATFNPNNYEAEKEIQFLTSKKVEMNLASVKALRLAINKFYNLGEGFLEDPILEDLIKEGKPVKNVRDKVHVKKEKLFEIWSSALIPLLIEKGIITEKELEEKFKSMKKNLRT